MNGKEAGQFTYQDAWAVRNGSGLLGVFYADHTQKLKPWHDGNRVALYRTKKEALKLLKKAKQKHHGEWVAYPEAKVVRVSIIITTK